MLALHIGLPKTGTTFLQYRIFNRLQELAYIHDPTSEDPDAVERLLRSYQRVGRDRLSGLEDRIVRALPDGDVLVSNENISIRAKEVWEGSGPRPGRLARRVARLAERLGDVRVVVGIRRQDQWLASRYAESAKHFPEFGQRDFDERVSRLCDGSLSGVLRWLDYDRAHAELVDRLGEGNVLLLPSEVVAAEPEAALASVERFLGCTGMVEAYQEQADDPSLRRNVLSVGDNRWQLRGRDDTLRLSDELSERVRERFAEGNRAVEKAAGFDLGGYGYY